MVQYAEPVEAGAVEGGRDVEKQLVQHPVSPLVAEVAPARRVLRSHLRSRQRVQPRRAQAALHIPSLSTLVADHIGSLPGALPAAGRAHRYRSRRSRKSRRSCCSCCSCRFRRARRSRRSRRGRLRRSQAVTARTLPLGEEALAEDAPLLLRAAGRGEAAPLGFVNH